MRMGKVKVKADKKILTRIHIVRVYVQYIRDTRSCVHVHIGRGASA